MSRTLAIVFSKHRTLQLKSLLLSIRALSDIPEESICVIYVDSPEIDYSHLKESFKCNFVRQSAFLEDLRGVIKGSKADFIMFMVDDLIFKDSFSMSDVEGLMDSRSDIDSFCFRMGRNISGPQPELRPAGPGILEWDAAMGLGKHWNYFWELSSSLYRRGLVEEYLAKCRPGKERFPNPLEFHYYSCMPSTRCDGVMKFVNAVRFAFKKTPRRIACYESSRCMTQGVNLVAELDVERAETFSPLKLHKRMLDGEVADFRHLKDFVNSSPNAGPSAFKLVKEPSV